MAATRKRKAVPAVSERDQERARAKWDYAHQALDAFWGELQNIAGLSLQKERDAAVDALDAMLAAAGVSES